MPSSLILRPIKEQKLELPLKKARVLGHLFFDGSVFVKDYHYTISYVNSSYYLIIQFILDIHEIYGLLPSSFEINRGKSNLIFRVKYYSKELYVDVTKYSKSYHTCDMDIIPNCILNGSKKIKLEFLKSFWEDEGSLTLKNRFKISADLKNYNFMNQLGLLHKQFGIDYTISKYEHKKQLYYKLFLKINKENVNTFFKLGLFELSAFSGGEYVGLRKIDVLRKIMNIRGYI